MLPRGVEQERGPWRRFIDSPYTWIGVIALAAAALAGAETFRAALRPVIMAYGVPGTALVTAKRDHRSSRSSAAVLELNYQMTPDRAPRPQIEVDRDLFASTTLYSVVAVHRLPACESCVVLDDDRGADRARTVKRLAWALAFAAAVLLDLLLRRD